jgi:hypothetical protein
MVRAMASRPLNPSERLDWLRLIRTENVGPVTFYQLLSRFGSAGAALEALPGLATRGGRRVLLAPYPRSFAERELAVAEKAGIALIAWGEPDYPESWLTNWSGNANCLPRWWSRSCSSWSSPAGWNATPATRCRSCDAARTSPLPQHRQ